MKTVYRTRSITSHFSYEAPMPGDLKGLSQGVFGKQKLLRFHGESIGSIPPWPLLQEHERRELKEALHEMSFNRARLIQKELACMMIALDPLGTLNKAMREGFVIARFGDQTTTTVAFTDFLPIAQEYACYVGPKNTLQFAEIFETLPFKLQVMISNSSPAYVIEHLQSVLRPGVAPLRVKIGGNKTKEPIFDQIEGKLAAHWKWEPYRLLHACDFPEPAKAYEQGAFFDPKQCPDVASLGNEMNRCDDFDWRNRLNLDLVDEDERGQYLMNIVTRLPNVEIGLKVLLLAMAQSPDIVRPLVGQLTADESRLLIERRVLEEKHLGWLSPAGRDHWFSTDLGL